MKCYQTLICSFPQTTEEFLNEYEDFVGGKPETLTGYTDAPYGYDSVWTIALMLHQAERTLQSQGM